MIAFRDQLVGHPTLEAAYLDIVRRNLKFPHLFLNQIVHVILRNVLDGCDDAFVLRAAEMLFRPQKLTLHEGSLVAADEETVSGLGQRPLSPLVSMLGLPAAAEIDVLNEDNAGGYWQRSDQFDMALDLTAGRHGLAALGEVIRRWIAHLLGVEVKIEPLIELQDAPLVWYVGLDAEGTRIGDALWNGEELDEAARGRVVGLYRLTFEDPNDVEDKVRGEPVYLIGAMTADKVLRLKPQNLLTGLPVRRSGGGELTSAALVSIPVGVVVERHKATSPWLDFVWRPVSVLPGVPAAAPWTPLGPAGDTTTFFAGTATIELLSHRDRRTTSATSPPARRCCGWCCARPAASRPTRCWPSRPTRPKARRSPRPATIWSRPCRCRQTSGMRWRRSSPSITSSDRSSSGSATARG